MFTDLPDEVIRVHGIAIEQLNNTRLVAVGDLKSKRLAEDWLHGVGPCLGFERSFAVSKRAVRIASADRIHRPESAPSGALG